MSLHINSDGRPWIVQPKKRQNGWPVGAIKSALRFDGAGRSIDIVHDNRNGHHPPWTIAKAATTCVNLPSQVATYCAVKWPVLIKTFMPRIHQRPPRPAAHRVLKRIVHVSFPQRKQWPWSIRNGTQVHGSYKLVCQFQE